MQSNKIIRHKKTDDYKLEILTTENLNLVKTEFDGKSRTKQLINVKLKNYIDQEPTYLQQVYAKGEENLKKGNRDIDIKDLDQLIYSNKKIKVFSC